jgi:hypothetical protein
MIHDVVNNLSFSGRSRYVKCDASPSPSPDCLSFSATETIDTHIIQNAKLCRYSPIQYYGV